MKKFIQLLLASSFLIMCMNATAAGNLKPAPDFSLKDASGKVHTLKDYHGKPLILQFWATWCPYCEKLQPGLNKIYNKFTDASGNHKVQVVGISFNEDKGANPQKVLTDRCIDFPTLLKGEKAAKAYGVKGTPTTFFITKNGKILWKTIISDPNSLKLHAAAKALSKL